MYWHFQTQTSKSVSYFITKKDPKPQWHSSLFTHVYNNELECSPSPPLPYDRVPTCGCGGAPWVTYKSSALWMFFSLMRCAAYKATYLCNTLKPCFSAVSMHFSHSPRFLYMSRAAITSTPISWIVAKSKRYYERVSSIQIQHGLRGSSENYCSRGVGCLGLPPDAKRRGVVPVSQHRNKPCCICFITPHTYLT